MLLRNKRVGFPELFFDLVFVFAFTQLVGLVHHDHSALGWARAGLAAWLVWWAWSQYAWAGNAVDLEARVPRLVLLAATAAMLVAAIALPVAFEPAGSWFAVPYAAVRLTGLGLYWGGLRHDPDHRAALRTYVPVALVSPTLVVAGGLAGPGARAWWWAAAVAVDLASVAAAGRGEFRIDPAHFAERHGLIVIITLGESVVAIGASAADVGLTARTVAVVVLAAALVGGLWWSYFDWVHGATEGRLAAEDDHRRRAHLARDLFTLGHLPIVIGAALVAVAIEEALAHPAEPLDRFGATALTAGPAVFLAGFVVGNLRATGQVLATRAAGVGVVILAGLALSTRIDAVAAVAALAAVIAAIGVVELRSHPRAEPHADPPIPTPQRSGLGQADGMVTP